MRCARAGHRVTGAGRREDAADEHPVAKEFELRAAFRFHKEFAIADKLLNKGLVDVAPLILSTLSYRDSMREFALLKP